VVAQAARRANADPAARVEISGYTDSAGSPQADVLLSQERAQGVADALVASGVAPNRLLRKGQGQTGSNPGVASRRVEISVGGL
jgi:outer membrane protein OmpA-like peptidoglycan-associated protein